MLAHNPTLTADAVDTSAVMLQLLRNRCDQTSSNASSRLAIHHGDALSYLAIPSPVTYDLIVTHFFLDCLAQPDVETLVKSVSARLTPGALWLISDFRIPQGSMRVPAKVLIRILYLSFRILTGLSTTRLPAHPSALARAGFIRLAQSQSLSGILATEIWTLATPPSQLRRL